MSFGEDIKELVDRHSQGRLGIHPTWARVRAGDVAELTNGFAYKSANFDAENGTPLLRIRDILTGKPGTFYNAPVDDPKMKFVQDGDIVIGMDGDFNSRIWGGGKALVNQRVCTLRADERFYSQKLLAYALPGYLSLINDHTSSVTVKHLSSRTVQEIPLPLPPPNEQHRIVEKIETLFARIDKGEEALREVQKLLKRYRQSILKAAVTGELTRDWRKANQHKLEPASDLLARILEARQENWQRPGKYQEPTAPESTRFSALPESWALCTTEHLAFVETGATPKKSESSYYSVKGTPWITSTAVNEDPIQTPQAYITKKALRETNAKVFPAGALIVAMYGEGKTRGKISELGIDSATNQACAALLVQHLPSDVTPYLKLFYLYNYEAIRRQSAGGVQPNLNLSIIKATQVPLPTEEEIGEILTRVNAELSRLEDLELICSTEIRRSAALRQSILKSAFTGQLVPQDPNDEPAAELLARIHVEREATPKAKSRRKASA